MRQNGTGLLLPSEGDLWGKRCAGGTAEILVPTRETIDVFLYKWMNMNVDIRRRNMGKKVPMPMTEIP